LSALIIGGSAAVLGTGLKAYEGLHQEHEANEIQKGLKDPIYSIPPEFAENREIARQMAQQGLPQAVINQQTDRINQNQAGGIDAITKSGRPGGVASVVRQGDQAGEALGAEDAQARNNNQRYFIDQNSKYAGQELAKQQSDVFDKYTRNFNQMQAYRGAGMQNVNSAVNDASQLGMLGIQYAMNNNKKTPDITVAPGTAQRMQLPPYMQTQYGLPDQTQDLENIGFNSFSGGYNQ
jgi:hypothetical protein